MRYSVIALLALLVLPLAGCVSLDLPSQSPAVREFTAGDVLEVLGVPRMAIAGQLDVKLLPQIAEALDVTRVPEALAKGATARGVTVFVIDDFSFYKFKDGRYHGEYVAAIIKSIAPDVRVLTCDAWKTDLGDCLFNANDLASRGEIQIVNMSLGIVGTYCEFIPQTNSFENKQQMMPPFEEELGNLYEPQLSLSPDQSDALEHWVKSLKEKGVVVISSAGNDGYKRGAKAPGCWSSLAVGATYDAAFNKIEWKSCTDENVQRDDRTCWSNYGKVFAPGAKVDNVFGSGSISFNGTSASAPIVSGIAALVIGTKKLTGEAVAERIIQTAVSIRDKFSTGLPHRRVDAVAASLGPDTPHPKKTLREFLDKNRNCLLDDEEILTALTLWIKQEKWNGKDSISDSEMLVLLNEWIKRINVCGR